MKRKNWYWKQTLDSTEPIVTSLARNKSADAMAARKFADQVYVALSSRDLHSVKLRQFLS